MAKVKYRIREFKPTQNQTGGHSFFAEAVVDNIITNKELGKKVEARTGLRAYEVQTALAAVAEIILEETAENNRVQIENADGTSLVSIYPSCSGSISDKEVQANPDKYNGATVATEDMLTADRIKWALGASIGSKFSNQFALNKQAQKVDYSATQETADPEPETPSGGGGNNNPPSGELEG